MQENLKQQSKPLIAQESKQYFTQTVAPASLAAELIEKMNDHHYIYVGSFFLYQVQIQTIATPQNNLPPESVHIFVFQKWFEKGEKMIGPEIRIGEKNDNTDNIG